MMSRLQPVSSQPEQIQTDAVNGKEGLRSSWRLEPSHLSFSLPRRLM
jgi:hypothetical protein